MTRTIPVAILLVTLVGVPGSILAQPPSPIDTLEIYEADAAHAGSTHRVAVQATLDPGFHVNSNAPLQDGLIATSLSLDPPDGISLEGVAWPDSFLFAVGPDDLSVFGEEFVVGAELALAPGLSEGEYAVSGTLRYQPCNDTMCFFPTTADLRFQFTVVADTQPLTPTDTERFERMSFSVPTVDAGDPVAGSPDGPVIDDISVLARMDEFTVAGTAAGYLNTDDFLEFIRRAESGQAEQGWFEGHGPLAILALILLGGLALNLTPCVLPMIPINLAIIGAGARAGSRFRGFALGSAYGLAMALVYGVLGLVVILTAGTFGTINASPWFNLGIAVLFVVLALAMFDVFQIDFSALQSKLNIGGASSEGGSFLVAFGMGGVAALLAGACVAPVVIQVIVFSSNLYATGTAFALALPFVLGVGMALPWPIAGAGLTFMPKPGAWMVRVKQAFGVFILGTAIYYGYLSYGLFSQRWVDPEDVATSAQELLDEGWYASLGQGLEVARAEDKLVLVDFWATWCKNCLTMDQTTLKDPAVNAALQDYVKVKFQAEDPSQSPTREVMERVDAIGLPTYAILRPPGSAPPAASGND